MKKLLQNRTTRILFVLITIGTILRFYNLNWGAPFYFHPDERNIASSISQMQFPDTLNPHFFAYGSLPLYTIFFTGLPFATTHYCQNSLSDCSVHFEDALIIGRAFSAIFSVLLIPLLYLLGKRLFSERAGIVAATLVTFSTGLIQFAHFATFEMWSTFFGIVLFLFSLYVADKPTRKNVLLLSITTGVLIAIKATNLLLLPVPFLAILFGVLTSEKRKKHFSLLLPLLLKYLFVILVASLLFVLTNPFTFLDITSFRGAMDYESGVALGTLPVFYTGEFYGSIPVIFQLLKVFPFLLNPALTILSIAGFLICVLVCLKKRSFPYFLLLLFTSLLVFPQAFFFVKWTRYMVPTLPFLILLCVFLLEKTLTLKRLGKRVSIPFTWIIVAVTVVFGVSYWKTAFVEKDSRVAASAFAKIHIPQRAPILADIYDMGIVTFNENFSRIDLFNYYDLDNQSPESNPEILAEKLKNYDYLIIPSQRIFATRLTHPSVFPEGYKFYLSLTTKTDSYQKLYETPCSIFCQITYLGDQIFRFEGTANAFERPPLQIFALTHNE